MTARKSYPRFFTAPKLWAIASLVGLGAFTVGCESASIHGRVIQGEAGIIASVSQDDSRKDQPGVGGVQIEVRTKDANAASKLVGRATTDSSGAFTLPINESMQRRDRLQLFARNEGYLPLRSDFYLSDKEKLVLVVMKNIGSTASGSAGASASADDRKRE